MASRVEFTAPKGTSDLLPREALLVRYVETVFAEVASRYAFSPVDTPIFEHTEVFERGVGTSTDIVGKEMYTFSDRADRSLTLRPEGTAPIVRAFVEHGIAKSEPLPWKVHYSGPMFRYERPQAGRTREFRQVGAESIGSADPAVDVEIIELAIRFYQQIGSPDIELLVNSMGDQTCRPAYVEVLKRYLKEAIDEHHDLCAECVIRLETNPLRILDCKKPGCVELTRDAPPIVESLCEECSDHFREVLSGLDAVGIEYRIEPRLVRGLDYYTRTTFELVSHALEAAQNAVGGGGRYDGLVEVLGGEPTPGIGFALGVERTIAAVEAGETSSEIGAPRVSVLVAPLIPEARSPALDVASRLRREGITTELGTPGRSAKAQLRLADRLGAGAAVIIGESEVESGSVTLKSLVGERSQASVAIADVPARVTEIVESS